MRFVLALASLAGAVALTATAASGRDAALRVPRGFAPSTASAVGARDLWVLGNYRCGRDHCNALVGSTDGGKNFGRLNLPPLPSQGIVPTIVFANGRDGFAYVEYGTPLYVTHDGGHIWRREGPNRHVTAFATAGGYAYLVARNRVERSKVGRNAWRRLALRASHWHFSLAAHGSSVWLLGPPRHRPDFDTITLSSDRGRTFTVRRGPCLSDLGGALVPTADHVVWAVCPTGNMGELALSTDGGRSFPAIRSVHDPGGLRLPSLVNSARIAAASARVAVLSGGGGGALLRTTDTGRLWAAVPGTARIKDLFWLAFATSRVGAAVVQTPAGAQLWRTADAGATWRRIPVR